MQCMLIITPFLYTWNTLSVVLIQMNQAETTKGKNVIVGEERFEPLEKGEKASLGKTLKFH